MNRDNGCYRNTVYTAFAHLRNSSIPVSVTFSKNIPVHNGILQLTSGPCVTLLSCMYPGSLRECAKTIVIREHTTRFDQRISLITLYSDPGSNPTASTCCNSYLALAKTHKSPSLANVHHHPGMFVMALWKKKWDGGFDQLCTRKIIRIVVLLFSRSGSRYQLPCIS